MLISPGLWCYNTCWLYCTSILFPIYLDPLLEVIDSLVLVTNISIVRAKKIRLKIVQQNN